MNAPAPQATPSPHFLSPLAETFGMSLKLAIIVFFSSCFVLAFAIFWFFHSAPPKTLTITSGPEGSTLASYAEKYRTILAAKGVTLKIISSGGSEDNLQRLNDPTVKVDAGFVQVGPKSVGNLMTLGSIAYQPLLIFYRDATPVTLLSAFTGKRLAIGPVGSGTRALALALLQANGVAPTNTTFVDLDASAAADALTAGKIDAAFLMGDSASPAIMKRLLFTPGIYLYNFTQADGYTRRITYLNKLELPMGSIDFGKNTPTQDVFLVGPTVELLIRPGLHPALSDLLVETAQQVHGGAKLFQHKGEFPAAIEYNYPLSPDAERFYKSGKSFLYRSLPYSLASLLSRILVSFVPLIVILIPTMRAIPAIYKWRIRMVIYRRYRLLLELERESHRPVSPERLTELLARLDAIEHAANKMKIPASFAETFYELRGHIVFVRSRLAAHA